MDEFLDQETSRGGGGGAEGIGTGGGEGGIGGGGKWKIKPFSGPSLRYVSF